MSVDSNHILYGIATCLESQLNVEICDETRKMLKKHGKEFKELDTSDKLYYANYSLKIVRGLNEVFGEISAFELGSNDEEIDCNFTIVVGEESIPVSLNYKSIMIYDVIPEKLMKICSYRKSTNIYKDYIDAYEKYSKATYKKIGKYEKYSDLKDNVKNKTIYEPLSNLVVDTISKKKKCAPYLYNHLFRECNRVVVKLFKNRFFIYDFRKEMEEIKSYNMKLLSESSIQITFNNKTKFTLNLHTNATAIQEHLSVKFRTNLVNMNELFSVFSASI